MGSLLMIHHEPHPNFDSPATQHFALEQRLSSCMAENAALREQAKRLRLTDEERRVLCELRDSYAAEDDRECNQIAEVLDGLLERLK